MQSRIIATATALFLSANALFAGELVEVNLDPISHADATLVVIGTDGSETKYTPAELETFTTYKLTTTTPWRKVPAEFEGVLLSDVLAAHGLDSVGSIIVTAENDFTTTMRRELLESVEILVATRVDGKAHSRRARGPIQFVIDAETFKASKLTSESNLVWMAYRIEPEG